MELHTSSINLTVAAELFIHAKGRLLLMSF